MTVISANAAEVPSAAVVAKNPAHLAKEVLDAYWGERGFPVDPAWIASRLGIKVVEMNLPKDVSGALVKRDGKDPIIAIEKSDSKNRRRFSCAHELGHYFGRLESSDEPYEYIDFRGPSAKTGRDPQEIFANSFAASLLMPESEVMRKINEGNSRISLAKYFGVSDEALSIRLSSLRLTTLSEQ